MSTDNTNKTFQTPEGPVEGTPDINYPKTAGFTPTTPVPVGGVILASDDIEYNPESPQHGRPAHTGGLALPFLRGKPLS